MVYCSRCGQWNPDGIMYCRACGSRMPEDSIATAKTSTPSYGPPPQAGLDEATVRGVVRRFRIIGSAFLIIGLASAIATVFLISYGVEGFAQELPFDHDTLYGLLGRGADGLAPSIVCTVLFCAGSIASAMGFLDGRLALLGGMMLFIGGFLCMNLGFPMDPPGFFDDNHIVFDGIPPMIFVSISAMAVCASAYPLMAACKIEREHLDGTFLQRMIRR